MSRHAIPDTYWDDFNRKIRPSVGDECNYVAIAAYQKIKRDPGVEPVRYQARSQFQENQGLVTHSKCVGYAVHDERSIRFETPEEHKAELKRRGDAQAKEQQEKAQAEEERNALRIGRAVVELHAALRAAGWKI